MFFLFQLALTEYFTYRAIEHPIQNVHYNNNDQHNRRALKVNYHGIHTMNIFIIEPKILLYKYFEIVILNSNLL